MQQPYYLEAWYIPKGKKTIFSAKKVGFNIENGVLQVKTLENNEEINSFDLKNALTKPSMGTVRFKKLEGQKNSMLSGPFIYMYNPMWHLISHFIAFFKIGKARKFSQKLNSFSELN